MKPRRSAISAYAAPAIAAIVLAASSDVLAQPRSPVSELQTAVHDLFSPASRGRRAKAKHTREPTIERSSAIAERSHAAERTQTINKRSQVIADPSQPAIERSEASVERSQVRRHATVVEESRAKRSRERLQNKPARDEEAKKASSEQAKTSERASARPPTRPAEAPPRVERAAKLAPSDGTGEATRQAVAPQREPTATTPVPEKGSGAPKSPIDAKEPATSEPKEPAEPPPPSACQLRLTPEVAVVQILPPISSGQCTAEDVVRLDAVVAKNGKRIAIAPPATLRCSMATALIDWIRDDVAAIATDLGAPPKAVMVDTSFECRSRNRVAGAKLSEHGHANAVDLRGFTLANGSVVGLTDTNVKREPRERLRKAACARFTTVLGPGSDGYHENHIHLDLAERRHGYRICQWDIRDAMVVAGVPLPPERPASAPPRSASTGKSGARD